jgi:hypothetical protein
MSNKKPDCTGERFGMLTVVSKSTEYPRKGRAEKGWYLLCDCGKTVCKIRGDFDKRLGIKSCGCSSTLLKKKNAGKKTEDLVGKRFGELIVIEVARGWNEGDQRTRASSKCRCDCGEIVWRTSAQLKCSKFLNCRGPEHLIGPKYPPMPTPMPDRVCQLLEEWHYTIYGARWTRVKPDIQDEKARRLERVCWIIAYRESNGEKLTELYIRNYLFVWLKNAGRAVRETNLNLIKGSYNNLRKRKLTGGEMTDLTSSFEAVAQAETQPGTLLPKKRSFRRC